MSFLKDAYKISIMPHESFTSGVRSLDKLISLDGSGIVLGRTYEISGVSGTGKSLLCSQLCVSIQMPEQMGGLSKKAIYISTDNKFSSAVLHNVAKYLKAHYGWPKEINQILSDVMVARGIMGPESVLKGLQEILDGVSSGSLGDVGVVVMDDLSTPVQSNTGREKSYSRHDYYNNVTHLLKKISSHGVAVLVCNRVYKNIDVSSNMSTYGGEVVNSWANYRCMLRATHNPIKRIVRLTSATELPPGEIVMKLRDGCFVDEYVGSK